MRDDALKQEMMQHAIELSEELGRPPIRKEFIEQTSHSRRDITSQFGTYTDMLVDAGVKRKISMVKKKPKRTTCLECDGMLSVTQRMYCSGKCKQAYWVKHKGDDCDKAYNKQQQRRKDRKRELVDYKKGKCEECGYNYNMSSLCFHHIDPAKKSFPLDIRNISARSMTALKEEADKCALLCLNCHNEHHYPQMVY